jgi:hypothetical protein
VITDVVVVPAAPLLLPEYQGRTAAVPGLLESCVAVLREAVASAHRVVVVHATDREARSSKPAIGLRVADHLLAATHENFEVEHVSVAWDAPVEDCILLGRDIAASPSDCVPVWDTQGRPSAGASVSHTGTKSHLGEVGTTLLVVGDGSARRTEKAPGHLDPRAADVDDAIVAAISGAAEGGLDRLLELDPELCADLLVAGRAPLQVLAAAAGSAPNPALASAHVVARAATSADAARCEVVSCEVTDPFGVLYVVAHLRLRH